MSPIARLSPIGNSQFSVLGSPFLIPFLIEQVTHQTEVSHFAGCVPREPWARVPAKLAAIRLPQSAKPRKVESISHVGFFSQAGTTP